MRKLLYISLASAAVFFGSCSQDDFADAYKNPANVETTTVAKQFAGFMKINYEDVIPSYWNYFTVLRTTSLTYTQAHGFTNLTGRFVPGAAVTNRWDRYYKFITQYRELEKVMASLPAAEQTEKRIFMITSTIYLYDHTAKMVDNFGDIPFSEAGKISLTGGDYASASAKYDNQTELYTMMLDQLKAFSTELNSITLSAGVGLEFKNQDLINKGNLDSWKNYCNSLRLRMLNRVSAVPAFAARANTEIAQIIADGKIVDENSENIAFRVYTQDTDLDTSGFVEALESWNNNVAPKPMIDHMNANNDPRKPWLFEEGVNTAGVYTGLDPLLASSVQDQLITDGKISTYNRSVISRNDWLPGTLINAAEVNLILAEYYARTGNAGTAKTHFEKAIRQSVEYYVRLGDKADDTTWKPTTEPTTAEVDAYIAKINFAGAATPAAQLQLIAFQKYIHYNIMQADESWAEQRRLKLPVLTFQEDETSSIRKTPPTRWTYPNSESVYNTENYNAVKANDNLSTKIFWDVK
ncbi:SusD-like starch-binding protein associating with outer membrane [Flavobacterium sp. 103]|uniref:SusD/RagB family nutrient-binding outer membrane lipoprotein n=1 Tax=unclassified Flavobacterium TaxID=196869 RepID=UPI000D5D4A49|nr:MULTISPECIES: SusD/RagB family nutrient-binding outer membrane lipoprotein [unclassified Flavobacterium]PVX44479.1 SusD-like starch-binding protein associating with outer membrane [Flavobacterium sp. 103]QKJ63416.1 SusD/RagB family nutrient-binding outer membrane lipoprotein [Flavobacterium sp. M31R6]